jgi:Na+/H+-translocating membrane pyrophosphatase
MAELHQEVRDRTDALDAAGNTTAAIGKGFAIGSACLVSLSLYGAFVTRSLTFKQNALPTIEITNGWIFGSLLAGGMLPYAFSALTMKAVGRAANEMVENIREQLKDPK